MWDDKAIVKFGTKAVKFLKLSSGQNSDFHVSVEVIMHRRIFAIWTALLLLPSDAL